MAQPVRRRPGELGVHSLDHFTLVVPDAADAEKFYGLFGLETREENGSLGLYTRDHPHRWFSVAEGPRKKLHYVSFGCFEEDLPKFKARLETMRIDRLDPPKGFETNGLWFRDPDGTLIELHVAEKSSPSEKTQVGPFGGKPGVANAPARSKAPRTRPRRLAHILLFTRDIPRTIAFYRDVLGMRLSDRSGDVIAFMHGIHGSDHHMIAFVKSDGPGLHHCSWDVASIDDIGVGANFMADKGFAYGWGLGRHVLGSNYFHYVRDPWGSYAEYSCDIDYIPVDKDWQDADHPAEDSFYMWGPAVPQDFATNFEAVEKQK
ncbi:MAG: metapyrocatechase [Alphaproteobacteria bacterium]|nr:metapyrocatechase [Alphaproteobacteria bacterium]